MSLPDVIPVPREVVEAVAKYLAGQPYAEVAEGMAHLQKAVNDAAAAAEPDPEPEA